MTDRTDKLDLEQPSIARLIEAIRTGVGVIPFVGAGLSVPYGLPSWRRFLTDLAKQANVAAEVEAILKDGDYEAAAETVRNAMSALAFDDALEDSFGSQRISWPATPTVVTTLATMAPGPVITTNFDHVLENVFDAAGIPFNRTVWGVTEDTVLRALSTNDHVLIKVHGDIRDGQHRVLTREEYERAYGGIAIGDSIPASPVAAYLRRLILARPLLFLGCSLDADRTGQELIKAAHVLGSTPHYTIQPKPTDQAVAAARLRKLGEMSIRVIWVPVGRYDLIGPMLEHILSEANAPRVQSTSPFAWAPEHFRAIGGPTALLRHDWPLVGREANLEALHAWVDDPEMKVAILPGAGGIGKTRLLVQIASDWTNKHPDASLRFATGASWNASAIHLTPGTNVLVIDDAHRSDIVRDALAFAHPAPRTKVLLTTRPYAIAPLEGAARDAGFDLRQTTILPFLKALSLEERRALAREVLGPGARESIVNGLARVSRDAPVIATIGGALIRERKIDPALLVTDREFADAIRRGFQETIEGSIAPIPYGADLRRLLHAIAATSPIWPENETYLAALAAWMDMRPSEVREVLGRLQHVGVLGQRGRTLHIAPEVLVDIMLTEACTDAQGRSTGYAVAIFDHFRSICPDTVIVNLSRLDWHLRSMGGTEIEPRLFDAIWKRLRDDYRTGTVRVRAGTLALIRGLTGVQPVEALSFVEMMMREEEDPDLIGGLPMILEPIGEDLRTAARAAQLLWDLGRDDPRSPGQNPNHGFRILLDLAAYDPRRPYSINEAVARAAARWLATSDAHTHVHEPLDIIAKALSPTATYGYTEGPRYVWGHVVVDSEETRPIREIALAALGDAVQNDSDRVVRHACTIVVSALRNLMPGSPDGIANEQLPAWQSHIDRLLELIATAVQQASPIVQLCFGKGLAQFDGANIPDPVRTQMQVIMQNLELTPELQRYAALGNGWDLWPNEDGTFGFRDWRARSAKRARLLPQLLATMFAHLEGIDARAEAIEKALARLSTAGVEIQSGDLFAYIAQHEPTLLDALIVQALRPGDGALATCAGSLLFELFKTSPERARSRMWTVLDEGNSDTLRRVALWGRICAEAPNGDDIELIKRLLDTQDSVVRTHALNSLCPLVRGHTDAVLSILLHESESGDENAISCLAEAIGTLIDHEEVAVDSEIVNSAIAHIGKLGSLDGYWVHRLLALAFAQDPEVVIEMLLDRIRVWADEDRPGAYNALPSPGAGFTLPELGDDQRTKRLLTTIRELALDTRWQVDFVLPDLYASVAGDDWSLALDVIGEWAFTEGDARIRASPKLLRGAPTTFIFDQVLFVDRLMNHIAASPEDLRDGVEFDLRNSAIAGTRTRSPGSFRGFDRDHVLLDRSSAVLETLTPETAAYRFYAGVHAHASASIHQEQLNDDEEFG